MSLHLYDSLTRRQQRFEPLQPGRVGIYVCGPTVQAPPHVGHVRSAIVFDQLRRWLTESGYDVTYIRNVTDIDDKILHDAGHEDIPWWQLAERNTRHFTAAYDAVGCLPPTYEPRATGHVPEMIVLMDRLIEAGHAYPSGGDVYFDVRSMPSYGALSGQRPDAMMATEKVDADRPKRDPLDFALWKGAKPGEPFWPTPWGIGRPGWHLECSAMATKYLGPTFDIHGGGLDLVFPHHENELAQSTCVGDGFAKLWMHHGLLNIGGEKMSKSLGNSSVAADVLDRVRPAVLRYYLGGAHYRSTLDYTDDGLAEATAAYGRIETFVRNAGDLLDGETATGEPDSLAWQAFSAAMDDDLAIPAALAVVHQAVRSGNAALAEGDRQTVAYALEDVRRMLVVLGLDPVSQWPSAGASDDVTETIDALVRLALTARADARTRKDFAAADAVRDQLVAAGIHVEDTAEGPRWRLRGEH
ncbi:cysteine--tRNA ligase [Acidothermaceae bacterium B102]|nr:cysteine--tRNA ligase [Acidothermaceae bacterium B102]